MLVEMTVMIPLTTMAAPILFAAAILLAATSMMVAMLVESSTETKATRLFPAMMDLKHLHSDFNLNKLFYTNNNTNNNNN